MVKTDACLSRYEIFTVPGSPSAKNAPYYLAPPFEVFGHNKISLS
jgi:hypothetical protein